jgi:hypothetical protein
MPTSCPIKKAEQDAKYRASPKGIATQSKWNEKRREEYRRRVSGQSVESATHSLAVVLASWAIK